MCIVPRAAPLYAPLPLVAQPATAFERKRCTPCVLSCLLACRHFFANRLKILLEKECFGCFKCAVCNRLSDMLKEQVVVANVVVSQRHNPKHLMRRQQVVYVRFGVARARYARAPFHQGGEVRLPFVAVQVRF